MLQVFVLRSFAYDCRQKPTIHVQDKETDNTFPNPRICPVLGYLTISMCLYFTCAYYADLLSDKMQQTEKYKQFERKVAPLVDTLSSILHTPRDLTSIAQLLDWYTHSRESLSLH